MLVLHGIFGSGKNWLPVTRQVVERRPDWGAVLVDLPEHGRSTGLGGEFTLERCAHDLRELGRHASLHVEAVMGHSFGGKVALTLAKMDPPALEQVWVIDSSLDALDEPRGDGWMMFMLLRRLPTEFASRDEAIGAMTSFGVSTPVAQWMVMNLERRGDRFAWRMDLDHIESLLRSYYAADLWDAIEKPRGGQRVHIVKATDSPHIGEEPCGRIEAAGRATGRVELHRVAGGHWLNVDNPQAMIELISARLP